MAERKYLICPQCGKKLCKASNPDMEIICQQCRSIIDVKSTSNGIELHIKYGILYFLQNDIKEENELTEL